MLKYKACPTLPQGGLDIGLKVDILAEIGYMLHECALVIKDSKHLHLEFWLDIDRIRIDFRF